MAASGRQQTPGEAPAPAFDSLAGAASFAAGSDRQAGASASAAGPKPRVLIVGGFMGGCCAALALGRLGCPVAVFERAPGDLHTQGAGLVVQQDLADFLLRHGVVETVEEVCVRSAGRQYVDASCRVVVGDSNPQLFSAWDVLHRAVKAKVPAAAYHAGSAVASVAASPAAVGLELEGGERHEGDLLVGCDGPGSLVRRTFLPEVQSEYQGYVAWRGFAAEGELPAHVLDFLANKFTVHQMPRSHILAYCIPGADGSTQPGSRQVNWVWYVNIAESDLPNLLRDAQGKQHLFSVPRGMLAPEVAAQRKQAARQELPSVLADLVCATPDVFVQAIHDLLCPRLALSGNACLLGDSACILRPHTAAGTTKAAVNATELAACLQRHSFQLGPALADYERSQHRLAERLVGAGRRIGEASQFPERSAAAGG